MKRHVDVACTTQLNGQKAPFTLYWEEKSFTASVHSQTVPTGYKVLSHKSQFGAKCENVIWRYYKWAQSWESSRAQIENEIETSCEYANYRPYTLRGNQDERRKLRKRNAKEMELCMSHNIVFSIHCFGWAKIEKRREEKRRYGASNKCQDGAQHGSSPSVAASHQAPLPYFTFAMQLVPFFQTPILS